MSICNDITCKTNNNSFITKLNCNHQFHYDCLHSGTHNKRCLICNEPLNFDTIKYDISGYISTKKMFETIIKFKIKKCKHIKCKHFEYPLNKGFCKQHHDMFCDDKTMRMLIFFTYLLSYNESEPLRCYRILDICCKILFRYNKKKYITFSNSKINPTTIFAIFNYGLYDLSDGVHISKLYANLHIQYEKNLC